MRRTREVATRAISTARAYRRLGFYCLDSRTPSLRSSSWSSHRTPATTRGPTTGPRPASSIPKMRKSQFPPQVGHAFLEVDAVKPEDFPALHDQPSIHDHVPNPQGLTSIHEEG